MAKDQNQGGPMQSPKDEPTTDRDFMHTPGSVQRRGRDRQEDSSDAREHRPDARHARRTGSESNAS